MLSREGESFSGQQSTPKRFLSSLKKNKVMPSPAGPSTSVNTGSIFTSLSYNERSAEDEGALSPIAAKEDSVSSVHNEPPLDPVVIVMSKNQDDLHIEEKNTEGMYIASI